MSERDDKKPSGEPGRVLRCDEWESLIADALDGNLNAADAAAFARHHKDCSLCAQMLKEAQQGKAWMEYLAVEPEVPAALLARILARTSGPIEAGAVLPVHAVAARPAWHGVPLPLLRQVARQVFEPRLMMTLAMAFFSIALTLNLTGIRLTEFRAADLRPSRMRATLTRQYYSTNEQVMKYYENLRLVYEMEARVRELRRSTEAEPAAVESTRPSPNQAPKRPERDGTGGPSSTAPAGQTFHVPQGRRASLPGEAPGPAIMAHTAPPLGAAQQPIQVPVSFDPAGRKEKVVKEVFRALRSTTEDQAERSLV